MVQLLIWLAVIFNVQAFEKLSDMSCDQLIKNANNKKYTLSTLAGLRAHKKCDNFKFDWRALSATDKRLYSDELLEIDPDAAKPMAEISIEDLRKKLNTENDVAAKFKIYEQLRQKYKNAGQRTERRKTSQQLYQWTQNNWRTNKKDALAIEHYLAAALSEARLLWNSDEIGQARDILKKLNSDLKKENLADSYFMAGKMAEDENKSTLALKNYNLAFENIQKMGLPENSTLDLDKLGWAKSWLLYKSEKWKEAEKALFEFSETTTNLSEKTRADFFRARILERLNKYAEAKALLRNIVETDFFSYYSLVSYHFLGEYLPALSKLASTNTFIFDPKLTFVEDSNKELFDALIKNEEYEIAEKAVPFFSKTNDQNVNVSLYLAEKSGRYLPLFSSFARLSNEAKIDVVQKYSHLIFPRLHGTEVTKMSLKTELSTSMIYSIMKQESGFNPKARSGADAFGLMQVIPDLAKNLSRKYEVSYTSAEDLYKPEINIALGTYELRDQIRKQNGQMTFVAAAYNAGPNALSGWLKDRKPKEDIFEFIENIPYDETRTYVKIIARNKLFYDRLENPNQSTPFPIEFIRENFRPSPK